MATIDDIKGKLDQLTGIKAGIKEAIISKGQSVGDNMTEYAAAIKNISSVKPNYLTFTADAESSVYLQNNGSNNPNCEYSFNGTDWITMPTTDADKVVIPVGEKIFVRGNNPSGFSSSGSNYSCFEMTGSISASGSVMSLIDGTGETTTIPSNYCFFYMFNGCSSLTTAPELPATTLADSCYDDMFQNCSALTTGPSILPAATLAPYCYGNMFRGCTSLTTAPKLPATTLADSCYASMFYGCSSLVTAPELPATTLAPGCYRYMFYSCSSLVAAPELPATTLAPYCYRYMFRGCSSLNYIKCLATDISATNCTDNWVYGVASTGTFIKDSTMTSWTTGTSGIPSGWSIQSAS